ncbi:MAG: hypothetical protein E6Q97_23870 [Desulfurellales bacterium]|nr:MAG: hypothetical protein E6Q97_23870 [Desulfurellales bacterium]
MSYLPEIFIGMILFCGGWIACRAMSFRKESLAYKEGFDAGYDFGRRADIANTLDFRMASAQPIKPEPRPSCIPTVKLADIPK